MGNPHNIKLHDSYGKFLIVTLGDILTLKRNTSSQFRVESYKTVVGNPALRLKRIDSFEDSFYVYEYSQLQNEFRFASVKEKHSKGLIPSSIYFIST